MTTSRLRYSTSIFYVLVESLLVVTKPGLEVLDIPYTKMVARHLISVQEVIKHSEADDCWIVVGNKVWDFTQFASIHPGGSNIIQFQTRLAEAQ